MPIHIKLDLATTSAVQLGNATGSITRGGFAWGFASDGVTTKETVFYAVLAALEAQEGVTLSPTSSTYPADPSKILTQVLMSGLSHDSVSIQLRYESPTFAVSTAAIFEVDSSLQTVERDKYPQSLEPIWIGWKGRTTAGSDPKTEPISAKIERDTAPFSYQRPLIRVSSYLMRYGFLDDTTTATNAGYIGTVNDATWLGRKRGAWLMTNYKSSAAKYSGYYSVRAEAIAKGGPTDIAEDWRVFDCLRSRMTGRRAVPDPVKITAALAAAYQFGPINAGSNAALHQYDPAEDGFIVHGPHFPVSFPSLWSILIS